MLYNPEKVQSKNKRKCLFWEMLLTKVVDLQSTIPNMVKSCQDLLSLLIKTTNKLLSFFVCFPIAVRVNRIKSFGSATES